MRVVSCIFKVVTFAFCLFISGGTAYAQWPIFGTGYGNYRPQESAFEAGARMARESMERAKLERTKYIRSATWPKDLTDYTKEVRYYLTQVIMMDKRIMSLTTVPGVSEEGMSVRFYGDTPIAYARINKNGEYSDEYWLKIGKAYSKEEGCYIWVCGDETTEDMFFKVSYDKEQVNIISQDPNTHFAHIYNTTKNQRENAGGVVSGGNYGTPNIEVGNSNSSGNKRVTCRMCNGTGKGVEQIIYAPDYTNQDRYCSQCGKWGSAHTHHTPACGSCLGKGYTEY